MLVADPLGELRFDEQSHAGSRTLGPLQSPDGEHDQVTFKRCAFRRITTRFYEPARHRFLGHGPRVLDE